jgi:hypothetical protein
MPRQGVRTVMANPITPRLAAATKLADEMVEAVLDFEAPLAEADMRANAPWNDVTGNARQGLFAQSYRAGGERGIVLYHTMPYGIYLETRWSGRFRVIVPALQRCGRSTMRSLRKIMRMI